MAKYYYNGVLLPEIPADVLAEYPYIFIGFIASSGKYQILASTQTMYFASNGYITRQNDNSEPFLYCVEGDNYWTAGASGNYGWSITSDRTLVWSNHDIPNGSATSTTIYFGALPVLSKTYTTKLISSTEAESGSLSGSAQVVDRESYSQNIVVDGITSSKGSVTLDFSVEKDGFYLVDMLFTHSGTRGFKYTLNGKTYVHSVVGTSYYAIEHYQFIVYLSFGINTIKFSGYSTSYAPMFDRFDIYEYVPYEKKFLIRSDSILYTIVDGALTTLTETEITASLFQTYGTDDLPDGTLLVNLTDPELLCWQDLEDEIPKLTLTITGIPPVPQTVITSTQDMSDASILGIEGVQATCSDDILFAISFDDEATWKAYDGTSWATLDLPNTGMTKATMENIGLEAWAEIVTSDYYKFRFILPTTDSYLTSLVVNYIN